MLRNESAACIRTQTLTLPSLAVQIVISSYLILTIYFSAAFLSSEGSSVSACVDAEVGRRHNYIVSESHLYLEVGKPDQGTAEVGEATSIFLYKLYIYSYVNFVEVFKLPQSVVILKPAVSFIMKKKEKKSVYMR